MRAAVVGRQLQRALEAVFGLRVVTQAGQDQPRRLCASARSGLAASARLTSLERRVACPR
jgi:hypothetical protein